MRSRATWVLACVLACALVGCGDDRALGTDAPVDAAWPRGAALYPADRTLSPLTPDLVAALREVHAAGSSHVDTVFAKLGDSHTALAGYLACFGSTTVDLGGRDLADTLSHFQAGDAAGSTPFERISLAATSGWAAFHVLAGSPSPLEQELAALNPAFATVMFGTNDIGYDRIDRFGQNLATIADRLLAAGTIPVFTTIPPRDDIASADLMVPRYNAIIRGIAQTRGVPLIDLHRELMPLAQHGLLDDNLHLDSFAGGACLFTAAGLAHGNNLRNLATLETLDRLRRTLVAGEPAPDAMAPRLAGRGTPGDPFLIETLPFADRRDTRSFGAPLIASYPACDPADEAGAEVYYRLDVTAPTELHAYAIDADADVDLHVLRDRPTAAGCLARGDTTVDVHLEPGTYYLVVDTFTSMAGDYVVVVTADGV